MVVVRHLGSSLRVGPFSIELQAKWDDARIRFGYCHPALSYSFLWSSRVLVVAVLLRLRPVHVRFCLGAAETF